MSPPPAGIYALEHEPYEEGAPVVIMIHGAMDRSASFGRVVASLSDLHVIVIDRRGYGRSAGAVPPASSLEDHTNDVLAVLEGRRATLVGHSYGGDVAMLTAIRDAGVAASVAAFEPPLPWLEWWPPGSAGPDIARNGDPASAVEAFIRRVAGDRAWEDLPAETQDARRAEGPALLADVTSIAPPASPFAPADCRVPLLLGAGTDSRDHQRNGARLLAEHTGAELVTIDGGGHLSHMTHPEAFAAFVRQAVALGHPT